MATTSATPSARELLAELEKLHERTGTRAARETLLALTGLLDADAGLVRQAVELVRERGDAFQQLVCCSVMARRGRPAALAARGPRAGPAARAGGRALGHRRAHARVPQPRPSSPRAPLSDTELRIVELVSDGFTNRQIAMAVRVSEKTVESHLTRLLARTGCRSRVELAAAHLEGKLTAAQS